MDSHGCFSEPLGHERLCIMYRLQYTTCTCIPNDCAEDETP